MKNLFRVLTMAVLLAGLKTLSHASGTSTSSMESQQPSASVETISLYDAGMKAEHQKDYRKAADLFAEAVDKDPHNADAFNMLAHCQRLLGDLDGAIDNYRKALKLRPNFPEAREYLGEAYLQGVQHEMELLKGYGKKGEEPLEDLTNALKAAAKKL